MGDRRGNGNIGIIMCKVKEDLIKGITVREGAGGGRGRRGRLCNSWLHGERRGVGGQ